ncbi:MAG: hybrid sensor histidine kinase/response regulator [Myxococcota bacterium]|nr:hybrid sensor histidine kinase/response regulator [Myxococcota bacterium]
MPPSDERPYVLYVDDEELNLQVFDANFRSRFRCLLASSGQRALELLAIHHEEVAVILSDQRMPEMTGVELLEQVRTLYPDVQRMVVTAYSDMEAVMAAVNRGQVVRYIVKPWVRNELAAALEDSLRIHRLQLQMQKLEVGLAQSANLAGVGQMAAGIAHELMNPVSYLSQNVEALRHELGVLDRYLAPRLEREPEASVASARSDVPAILSDLETAASQIRHIASQVKQQARGAESESECDLPQIAAFAVKMSRATVGRAARLQHQGPEPLRVLAGPVRLTQVLVNLIINAGHAAEGSGRPGLVVVQWSEQGERAQVEVRDNGCGIPPENLEKVFQPLFTTKAAGVGTGLGLGISRQLVREMGGELTLSSEVDRGTTVTLLLPKA